MSSLSAGKLADGHRPGGYFACRLALSVSGNHLRLLPGQKSRLLGPIEALRYE